MTKYVFKISEAAKPFEVYRTDEIDCLTSAIDVFLAGVLGYDFVLHGLSQNKRGVYLAKVTDKTYQGKKKGEYRSDDVRFTVKEVSVDMSREPTLKDFTDLLDASGLSDREASERMHLHPNYVNRLRRGDVAWRPIYYMALKGLVGAEE